MKAMMKKTIIGLCVMLFTTSCGNSDSSSYSSEGYGEYHNVYSGERQSSYKGSVEQQEDISKLDKMIEEGY